MYSWSDLASSRTVWDNFFWSLTMFVFERSKTLYFCVRVDFFSKTVSITFATHFCGTCPHTKKMNYQLNVVLKKQSFVDGGKNKIIFGWASRIWEDFLDRPFMQKTKKFRSFYILSRLGRSLKWNWLKQFSCRFASSLSKLRILERQIRGSQRNCFLCCWLGIRQVKSNRCLRLPIITVIQNTRCGFVCGCRVDTRLRAFDSPDVGEYFKYPHHGCQTYRKFFTGPWTSGSDCFWSHIGKI